MRVLFPVQFSSRRIALGVSIGVLIAFSPTIGFQMGLALVAASIFNASRLAAVACVWITNPLTTGPIFALTYAVGRPFWNASPDVGFTQLSQTIGGGSNPLSITAVFNVFRNIHSLGTEMIMPMLIGGLITGAVAGGLCYFPAKAMVSFARKAFRRKSRVSRRGAVITSNPVIVQEAGPVEGLARSSGQTSSRRRAA